MPETDKTPAVVPADPNKSETAQVEKAAATLIVNDLKQSAPRRLPPLKKRRSRRKKLRQPPRRRVKPKRRIIRLRVR